MIRPRVPCPGCDQEMAKGSRLCRDCRHRAVDVGVTAVLARHQLRPDPAGEPQLTDGQRRAFYAKAHQLDYMQSSRRGHTRQAALAAAASRYGRPISSVNDLRQEEASWVLDQMEDQLEALQLVATEQ